MSQRPDPESDHDRGKTSRKSFGTDESGHPIKDTTGQPNLSQPAERAANPATHPSQTDGLGQPETTEHADEVPVPAGDPSSEKDRTDLQ